MNPKDFTGGPLVLAAPTAQERVAASAAAFIAARHARRALLIDRAVRIATSPTERRALLWCGLAAYPGTLAEIRREFHRLAALP